jgi:hypothetical protein
MNLRAKLQRIFDIYDVGVIKPVSATSYFHKIKMRYWLAGIMMCETEGGLSPLLVDVCNTPDIPDDDVGDSGHGHGLWQIDDRSYPDFCLSEDWKDAYKSALKVSEILEDRDFTLRRYSRVFSFPIPNWERAILASYNAGAAAVVRAIRFGFDVDKVTTGRNYSARVLQYAAIYEAIVREQEANPIPPAPVAAGGVTLSRS